MLWGSFSRLSLCLITFCQSLSIGSRFFAKVLVLFNQNFMLKWGSHRLCSVFVWSLTMDVGMEFKLMFLRCNRCLTLELILVTATKRFARLNAWSEIRLLCLGGFKG